MKTVKKIIYGTFINLLAILSTLLAIFEFIKSVIKKTLEGGLAIFTIGITAISVLASISFIFGDHLDTGWKIFCLILLWILYAVFISVSNGLWGLIIVVANFVCGITNTRFLILICQKGADILIDKYDALVDNNPSKKDIIFYGGIYIFTEKVRSSLTAISPILSICTYILFTVLGGIWGFNIFYADDFFMEMFNLTWWLNAAGTLLFGVLSLCLGFVVVDACEEAIYGNELTDEYEESRNYEE